MCFQFLQSVVHGVQWYVFCFGYTDKMPIIIIFDPSGSCVIFARSIFIIFCLHTKKSWYLHSYTAKSIPILLPFTKQMWLMTYRSWILHHLLRFRTNYRHICKWSDQKILYSIKVNIIFDGVDVVVYVAIFSWHRYFKA